jgi:hypothetical protein
MRNANAQRPDIMGRVRTMRQLGEPHVSHAMIGGLQTPPCQDGQRCALLTTKSRNTCTRATVFSSSG